jgi:CheY-like chemotaxis protein
MNELSPVQLRSLKSLRRAVLAAAVIPLCILITGGYLLWLSSERAALRDVTWRADVARENIAGIIDGDTTLLKRMQELTQNMSDADVRAHESELHSEFAALALGVPRIHSLFMMDAQGDSLVSSLGYPSKKSNGADRDYFLMAKDGNHSSTIVSERMIGRSDPTYQFNIAIPRYAADGSFAGVYAISMATDYFENGGLENRLANAEAGVSIGLIRDDGRWLFRVPMPTSYANYISKPLRDAIRKGQTQGSYDTVSLLDGKHRLGVFQRVGNSAVVVISTVTWDAIRDDWTNSIMPHLFFGVPAYIAIILMTLYALRKTREAMVQTQLRIAAEEVVSAAGAIITKIIPSETFRIMLVDDDHYVAETFSDLMSEMDCHVTICHSAEDALALLQNDVEPKPGLILSDIGMVGKSGFDLAQAVAINWPDVPVILMTGDGDSLTTGRSLQWVVLQKPIAWALLQRVVLSVKETGGYHPENK